jgi:hypothetical protein
MAGAALAGAIGSRLVRAKAATTQPRMKTERMSVSLTDKGQKAWQGVKTPLSTVCTKKR